MKKGQATLEFLNTYGWAISAAIIVIVVLTFYFYGIDKSNFRITKEECRNESKITDYKEIGRTEAGVFYSPIYIFEEVCEQVEVEGISIYTNGSYESETRFNKICNIEDMCECIMLENNICEMKITPKKLTIEWLKENCECSKPECSGIWKGNIEDVEVTKEEYEQYKFQHLMYNGSLVCGGSSSRDYYSFSLEKNPGCSNYKCQDYTIEVKDEIK